MATMTFESQRRWYQRTRALTSAVPLNPTVYTLKPYYIYPYNHTTFTLINTTVYTLKTYFTQVVTEDERLKTRCTLKPTMYTPL